MDTASHLLFGATLAGLAALNSEVASNPALFSAVLTLTMAGSHAPDLDTAARLRGYAAYIRVHRGLTHSLPALFLWPLLLAVPAAWLFGVQEHWLLLTAWTFAAVVLHVGLDWCNAYGVQCFRPLTKRWQHLDALPLFDPLLFGLHAAGVLLWLIFSIEPGPLFAWIYGFTVLHIGLRLLHHHHVVRRVPLALGISGTCQVIPSLNWFRWQFVLETPDCFYTGVVQGGVVLMQDVYNKAAAARDIRVEVSRGTDGVRAFLQFAQRVHVVCREQQDGYIVQWRDVRFWHNHQLPFGVDVRLDRDLNVVSHSLGWRKKAWDPPFV